MLTMEIVKKEGLLAFSLMRLMKRMDPTLLEDSYEPSWENS